MRQIRNSVFETNSSSMHSLVIKNDNLIEGDIYFTLDEIAKDFNRYISDDGIWEDWDDDWYFGRAPFKLLGSFKDKWKYAYASLVFDFNKEDLKNNNPEWISKIEASKEELITLLKKAVPEIKDFTKPTYSGTDDYMLSGWLNKLNISLEEFLFSKKYIVVCDGDEYHIWDRLTKTGLIDLDNIKELPEDDEVEE